MGYRNINKICQTCKAPFVARSGASKWCDVCRGKLSRINLRKPQDVRRQIEHDGNPSKWWEAKKQKKYAKDRVNIKNINWPTGKLDYKFIDRCKKKFCFVEHPSEYQRRKGMGWEISILPWSRGSYIDIRKRYFNGSRYSPVGILLHQDVLRAMLPDIVAALREVEMTDTREPEQKAKVTIRYPDEKPEWNGLDPAGIVPEYSDVNIHSNGLPVSAVSFGGDDVA